MYQFPESLYEINMLSVTIRILLAFFLGGIIGMERGANRHPAGFRTHILVCAGAALAMMTNQFMMEHFGSGDPARLGAQVIAGVGFLGVGTILVTGRYKIKGLTTAAGLWASACLGLAIGIGFYSGALITAAVIFISLSILPKVENYFYARSRVLDLYIEVASVSNLKEVGKYIKSLSPTFYESHIIKTTPVIPGSVAFNISFILHGKTSHEETVRHIESMEGVYLVEEL